MTSVGTLGRALLLGAMLPSLAHAQQAASSVVPAIPLPVSLDSLLGIRVESATKHEQSSREAPASVTVVTREDIRLFGYRTLDDLLVHVRDFYGGDNRAAFQLGTRGFGPAGWNNRVVLLVDGHLMNDNVYGSASLGPELGLSLDAVDRVEIVRGPGSVAHGGEAIFAVVNMVTRTGAHLDGGTASVEVGSGGLAAASSVVGVTLGGSTDVAVSVFGRRSAGQDAFFPDMAGQGTDGWVRDMDSDRMASGHVRLRHGRSSLSVHAVSRTKDLPTAPYGSVFGAPGTRVTTHGLYADAATTLEPDHRTRVDLRAYADLNRADYDFPHPAGLEGDARLGGDRLGVESVLRWDPTPGSRLQFGGEIRHSPEAVVDITVGGQPVQVIHQPYTVLSTFTWAEWQPRSDLRLNGGLRFDHYTHVGSAVSPRLALLWHASTDRTFKVLYGRGFRPPNHAELYVQAPGLVAPSPGLDPEFVTTVELVWEERVSSILYGTASAFHYGADDLVEEVYDAASGMIGRTNAGHARAHGLSGELTARTPSGFVGRFGWTWADARDDRTGARLINSPEHLLYLAAGTPFARYAIVSGALRRESGRASRAGNTTPAHMSLDLHLALAVPGSPMGVTLDVRNATDATPWLPASSEYRQDLIPGVGREIAIGARIRF